LASNYSSFRSVPLYSPQVYSVPAHCLFFSSSPLTMPSPPLLCPPCVVSTRPPFSTDFRAHVLIALPPSPPPHFFPFPLLFAPPHPGSGVKRTVCFFNAPHSLWFFFLVHSFLFFPRPCFHFLPFSLTVPSCPIPFCPRIIFWLFFFPLSPRSFF